MLLFCPMCGNLLLIQQQMDTCRQELFCQSCPYVSPVHRKYTSRQELQRKQVDDVLGGADAWQNVDSTEATCPKCENERAFYMQIQIRSADEPSSIFYRCCNSQCNHQWREG